MRSPNTSWGQTGGVEPKQRDIAKDNESMPQELKDLGERMQAIELIKEGEELGAELLEVWDEL